MTSMGRDSDNKCAPDDTLSRYDRIAAWAIACFLLSPALMTPVTISQVNPTSAWLCAAAGEGLAKLKNSANDLRTRSSVNGRSRGMLDDRRKDRGWGSHDRDASRDSDRAP